MASEAVTPLGQIAKPPATVIDLGTRKNMSTSDFIAARAESKNAQRERAALGLMIAIVKLAREIKKCQTQAT